MSAVVRVGQAALRCYGLEAHLRNGTVCVDHSARSPATLTAYGR